MKKGLSKVLASLLVCSMVFGLVACGNQTANKGKETADEVISSVIDDLQEEEKQESVEE